MAKKEENDLGTQALMEQGETAYIQVAKVYGSYFKELRKEGFSRHEAFTLVLAAQTATLGGSVRE